MPAVIRQRDVPRIAVRDLALGACWAMVASLVVWSIWAEIWAGLLAVVCVGLMLFAFWGHPRLAFVSWVLSLVMVPTWISFEVFSLTIPVNCIVAAIAVVATISQAGVKFSRFDAYFAAFLGVCLTVVLLSGSSAASWVQILLRWCIPFVAARVLVSATGTRFAVNVIAAVLGLVGGLAVLELLLTWHPFVGWVSSSPEFDIWHTIQIRNGVDRSEWAFGHSIALGGTLALSVPFILRSSYHGPLKIALLTSVSGGILTTASRGALIAAVFTAAICLICATKNRIARIFTLAFMMSVILLASSSLVPVLQAWLSGTSGEERGSFQHRNDLYSTAQLKWFGPSSIYDGGKSSSLDSAILQIGLGFGWIALALVLLPLALSAVRIITGRASTAEMAIIGQIPLFTSVALITQYASMVFLVVGMAVQTYLAAEAANSTANLTSGTNVIPTPLRRGHTRISTDKHLGPIYSR